MRILIDTNIFIHLEDTSEILDDSFSELYRLAKENKDEILIHKVSLDDINKDKNNQRREVSLSKIKKYSRLDDAPIPEKNELESLGLKEPRDNDRIDNIILYAIYKDAANILITEDHGLHKKAKSLGLSDRVHYIQQATEFLKRLYSRNPVPLNNIKDRPLHNVTLAGPFFDSLREGYSGFNDWFRGSAREGRKAWIYESEGTNLGAICIYKEEDNPVVTDEDVAIRGKVLKLCTFKVDDNMRGRKIGELLFKTAFIYATHNKLEHIYITMKLGKQLFLQELCEKFGFENFGNYKGDAVFVKKHPVSPPVSDLKPLDYHIRYFPHFKRGPEVGKYVIPIQPQYHEVLFPEKKKQIGLFAESTAGNAIKQAYLCHARIGGMMAGDIVLFYRSHDQRAITSLGVVELVAELQDLDKIIQIVSKRTVYRYEELQEMSKKKTKVILFRLSEHLSRPKTYDWLLGNDIVKGSIQTIRSITDESFEKIMQ